jgi:hypothetical protein
LPLNRILLAFKLECLDYTPKPTYKDGQLRASEARNKLTQSQIREKHERLCNQRLTKELVD